MNNFSPNMLKTFKTCAQKYYLKYITGLSVPQKSYIFDKGKKIHALAHYYLRGDDISKLVLELNEDEKQVWDMLCKNEYFNKSYVNSEYNLSCKVGNFWIGGRLDAIVRDENNIYILDYKTGQIPKEPDFDYQTMTYLLCLDSFVRSANLKIPVHFVYIDLKNNTNYVVDFDDEKRTKYISEIINICEKIENFKGNVTTEKSKICEFCEYKKFCS